MQDPPVKSPAPADTASPFKAPAPLRPRSPSTTQAPQINQGKEIFGFVNAGALPDQQFGYPSWNYDLLTTVAYFDFTVDPGSGHVVSGNTPWNVYHSSTMSDFISVAHSHGVKVVFSIGIHDFSASQSNMCLGLTAAATTQTVADVESLLSYAHTDGVNVDYEGLNNPGNPCPDNNTTRTDLLTFVKKLRTALPASAPCGTWTGAAWATYPCQLTIDTYTGSAYDNLEFFDVGGLAGYVDEFFVMAYDMDVDNAVNPPLSCSQYCMNPIAALNSYAFNDTDAITTYLKLVSPNQLVLGVPYYARDTCTSTNAIHAIPQTSPFASVPRYVDAVEAATDPGTSSYSVKRDNIDGGSAVSTWVPGPNGNWPPCPSGTGPWREMYWDDVTSLSAKYQLANKYGIRGVGMFTLDYGGGYPELWQAIANNFTGIHFSADPFNVGSAPINYVSSPSTLVVTNTSNGSLTISGAVDNSDLSDTAQFSVVSGSGTTCIKGATIAVGHTCTIQFTVKPSSYGPRAATFTLTDSDPTSPQVLPLDGFGLASSYHLSAVQPDAASSWYEIDTQLRKTITLTAGKSAIVGANIDLWTATAGFNQDVGIFANSCSLSNLLAWKESGGFAGTYSPNAAYVQTVITTPGTYTLMLCWKANKPAPAGTIYGAAGTADTYFSPSGIVVKVLPSADVASSMRTQSYHLDSVQPDRSSTWYEIDPALRISIQAPATGFFRLGGNADLWTATAGYNQDLAIFSISCSASSGPAVLGDLTKLVGWKESGGFAGTLSPNAAFVEGVAPASSGQTSCFTLAWKANQPAPAHTVYAGAGTSSTYFSPTRLTAEFIPSGSLATSGVNGSYQLDVQQPDRASTWYEIDPNLRVTVTSSAGQRVILGGNIDLWTANAGYNQDVGIFLGADCSNLSNLLAWKESGGSAGTFSPNAAYVQAVYTPATAGPLTFTLCWKANVPAPPKTVWAGAGTSDTYFSPTRLTAELMPFSPDGQYQLGVQQPDNASTWYEIDPTLRKAITVASGQAAIVDATTSLGTTAATYNQDLGIFKTNCSLSNLLAWQESGGVNPFAPNAVSVQDVIATPGTYTLTLCWKANQPAPPGTIFAGAGTADTYFSSTSLTTKLVAAADVVSNVATKSYNLGVQQPDATSTWYEIDPALRVSVTAPAVGNLVVDGNMDLWTSNAGYDQDLGIFAISCSAPATPALVISNVSASNAQGLVAWKEAGGAGAFSPDAALVEGAQAAANGQTYCFTLAWKANAPAPAGTVYGAAGTSGTYFSPTRLTAEFVPSSGLVTSSTNSAYQLGTQQPDMTSTWYEIDPGLRVTVSGTAGQNVLLGGNIDLWTSTSGYGQDVGIFLGTDCSNLSDLLAWQESAGAATSSSDVTFVQTVYQLTSASATTFTLCWKGNKPAPIDTIQGGVGSAGTYYSPTRLTAEFIN